MTDLKEQATKSLQKQEANQAEPTTGDGSVGSAAKLQVYLTKYKDQVALALPKHISADRMIRVAMTAINKTPRLQEVQATTLFGCLIQSYQLGLEPDNGLGHSWILPFKNSEKSKQAGRDIYDAQLIIGYQGMNELAYRTGFVKALDGAIVYASDPIWDFQRGTGGFLHHRQTMDETKREDMIATYAVAELVNGGSPFVVLKNSEIMAAMLRSQTQGRFGPWKTDFEAMAIKTAYRRLSS